MHKIYVFSNVQDGGDGVCFAIGDDGAILGSHWCSNEGYAPYDLGVEPGTRPDRHKTYAEHFPDGYEMEMVWAKDRATHAGLQKAIRLNKASADG